MDISQRILSDITVFNKYAKYTPELKRRETWMELCHRNKGMHLKKYSVSYVIYNIGGSSYVAFRRGKT